jgi:diacylglycerol kinase
MKWELFKELTDEQQAEYMFKFSDRPRISFNTFFLMMTNFIMIILMLLMMYYMMMNNPAFEQVFPQVQQMVMNIMQLAKGISIVAVVYIIFLIGEVGVFYFREYRWIKKNRRVK